MSGPICRASVDLFDLSYKTYLQILTSPRGLPQQSSHWYSWCLFGIGWVVMSLCPVLQECAALMQNAALVQNGLEFSYFSDEVFEGDDDEYIEMDENACGIDKTWRNVDDFVSRFLMKLNIW